MVIRAPARLRTARSTSNQCCPCLRAQTAFPNGMFVTILVCELMSPVSSVSNDARKMVTFSPGSLRSAISHAAESTSSPMAERRLVETNRRVEYGPGSHEGIEDEAVGIDAR